MAGKRIEWLAVLRGLNILLVVMYHVQLIDMSTGDNHLFCSEICKPFNDVRMPLFIFCSGGLLYLSRIEKNWQVNSLYLDKVKRIVCPFLFFVPFFYFFKMALNPFVKTKVVFSVSDLLESFYIYPGHPSSHLWFLSVLFCFMLLYPLFKWLCKRNVRMYTFLVFTIVFYFIDIPVAEEKDYFYFFTLNKYLVYFFFGIFFFRYRLYEYLNKHIISFIFIVLYVICYLRDYTFLTSIFGILSMIYISKQIARIYPNLFISFREYIYQIFLMSFIFQPFVELILWKKLFYNENFFFLFYILNILFGIYLPVFVSKLAERTNNKYIKLCLGLR